MPAFLRFRPGRCFGLFTGLALALLGACQSRQTPADAPATPPVGHYQGGLTPAGQPELRAALDIRHPRPGHYEAELTVPGAPALSFVADTIYFQGNSLRLSRPAQPSQELRLTLEGDFWHGTLAFAAQQLPALLLRRGSSAPAIYRVRTVDQSPQTMLQFMPADESSAGPAVFMLPDSAGASGASAWADAFARQGIIMQLPVEAGSPSISDTATASYLRLYLNMLRGQRGADTAQVGLWLTGRQALWLPAALADTSGHLPPLAFAVLWHPAPIPARDRAAWRRLGRRLRILALCGPTDAEAASSFQEALAGTQRGRPVRRFPAGTASTTQMQAEAVEWLRQDKGH